ncbi:MAG: type VI secretion system tube protein Hcp [Alphaproteobacteria bacterium]|nr:type VI secretion system tube protein Hcp [Alphaproteobacteria bacterium]
MRKSIAIIIAFTLAAGSAQAAGYLKLGDIKGEATEASDPDHDKWINVISVSWGQSKPGLTGRQSATLTIKENQQAVLIGLLLPAVQKARSTQPSRAGVAATTKKARRMTYDETSGRRVVKRWTLHDVEYQRLRARGRDGASHTLNITYKCKDWTVIASGKTGSDCNLPARKKGGNVETNFKVEEGE